MIAFIDDHRDAYGVEPICKVLPIAPSTYHDHAAKRRDPALSARAKRDPGAQARDRRVFAENFEVYGVRKVWRQLRREGFDVARCTVERLMRADGFARGNPRQAGAHHDQRQGGAMPARSRQPAVPGPGAEHAVGLGLHLCRDLAGFVYVAFVIDAFARRIVGWRVSRTAHASFVLDALEQALHERRPPSRAGSSTTAIAAANTSRSNTPSAWPRPGSSLRSAASATATTTPSPKPSTASTRPR
jgi:putative transposase